MQATTTEAIAPASLIIPDGSNSVTFEVSIVDDADADGTQSVTLSASAPGYTGGSDLIFVTDDESSVDVHGDDAAGATLITANSLTAGELNTDGDTDWFRFSAVAGDFRSFIFQPSPESSRV